MHELGKWAINGIVKDKFLVVNNVIYMHIDLQYEQLRHNVVFIPLKKPTNYFVER